MSTPIEFVNKQWEEWREKNPVESIPHVDLEKLKQDLIGDLTYASKMDVKEYTLYQKWCEIKEKYPTKINSTLWGDEENLVNEEHGKLINQVKNNFWMPNEPDDYLKLKPTMVLSNGELAETWNTIRTFTSTMKNNSNIGRNLFYTLTDEITGKYLGVICISSDFLDLTPRDNSIGWSRDVKTHQGMINHTAIGSTIVPLQPLGFNYVGGKLLALMCLSDTVQKDWKERYDDVLVGVTTTSLYGNTKSNGMSQYDGLQHWDKMGFSAGSVSFEPRKKTMKEVFYWIRENYPRKYFEWWEAKNQDGLPLKRDHKNRSLNFAYTKLGIPKELIKADHQRGIYFSRLYSNTDEFLRKEISEDKLIKSFDTKESTLSDIWKNQYVKGRISMLKKKNNVSYETLFYSDMIFLSWEETKNRYLSQVGR